MDFIHARPKGKKRQAAQRLQATFGSEVGFRFARMAKGCITHGQYFKKGEPHVEMAASMFEYFVETGIVKESVSTPGCYFLVKFA
jgi:hypothetical protein